MCAAFYKADSEPLHDFIFIMNIAVSTRPPAGVVSALRASVRRIYRASRSIYPRSYSLGPCGPL